MFTCVKRNAFLLDGDNSKSPTSSLLVAFWLSICLGPILFLHRREGVEMGS